jgi:AraC family transcriptional regulator of adaptative response/methylated-DNA-[protein]-cysteine methyltransferase
VLDRVREPAIGAALRVPLDVDGTAFQWMVWKALQAIPAGERRTYTEIAKAIGRPTAARAVARACATNRVAVVIPCHRVVRESGELSGYKWGADRKRRLLEREKK